jgi:hypothetical protein
MVQEEFSISRRSLINLLAILCYQDPCSPHRVVAEMQGKGFCADVCATQRC